MMEKYIDILIGDEESVFLSNLHYFYAQTDGTYDFPKGVVGDMLKQAKKEIEELQTKNQQLVKLVLE